MQLYSVHARVIAWLPKYGMCFDSNVSIMGLLPARLMHTWYGKSVTNEVKPEACPIADS